MSETAVLIPVVSALFAIALALVAVVWGTLKERIASLDTKVTGLESQNTSQETAIGRITERAIAREQAHSEHREHTSEQFARLEAAIGMVNTKLDQIIRGRTPYPTSYGGGVDRGNERK